MTAAKNAMLEKQPVAADETTLDGLLNRRLTLEQPAEGYRVAVDTVLLAAAVPARASEKIIDLGCGVGGAMLCLAARVPGLYITGIEIQDELRLLCRDNIARNKLPGDLSVQAGDVLRLPAALAGRFDHAIMNPPYHDEARHDVSAQQQKRVANSGKEGDLALWISNASHVLKPAGILTLIHRGDRKDEITGLLKKDFGTIEVLPIVPKTGAAPKRVVIRAAKGGKSSIRHCRPLVLHRPGGGYSDEAEVILRHAKALEFIAAE